ncbi:hypothetical protein [Pseudalkalibacillus decolorationis]|nr:hypothetical protein [Pseudalkalibacillus decolorationis]
MKERASMPMPKMKVSKVKKDNDKITWSYPDEKVNVKIERKRSI